MPAGPEEKLNIHTLIINSDKEIINKIVKEILVLFKITADDKAAADYDMLEISSEAGKNNELTVTTSLCLTDMAGKIKSMQKTSSSRPDENPKAAVNRLIKLNLYYLLDKEFGPITAPWGILHGVRPAKIVHRYIENGLDRSAIIERLMSDYAVSHRKACLLTDIAYKQLPVMSSSDKNTVSVYIGIPFCLSRCLYCSFPSGILPSDDAIDSFMAALHKEVLALKELIERYSLKVQNIYIGGGTPTSLSEKYFSLLLKYADSLKTDADIEFTVEAGRPDSIDIAKIELMNKYSVNRISVNPQSMQERTLKIVGRKHTPQDIVDIYHVIRNISTARINMDLILGLPGESAADVHDTIDKIVGLAPDDITVHALAIKKGSALKQLKDDIKLPDDAVVTEMAQIVETTLRNSNYLPYYLYRQGYMSGQLENIGYCRDGAASIYNIQIMSERQTILGIGGNASTKIVAPSGTYLKTLFNPKDLKTYVENVDDYIMRRSSLAEEVYGK